MNITVSGSRIEVEHNITPPMCKSVTIPVTVENGAPDEGIAIYLTCNAFTLNPPTDARLRSIAKEIVTRLGRTA